MQPRFSKSLFFQILALVGLIGAGRWHLTRQPDREELGERSAIIQFAPADWTAANVAPLRLAGAWALASGDPRIGGVSALALDRGRFVALTDSGAVLRFARPAAGRAVVRVSELPGGPGSAAFKVNRDSEAIAADPLGRGWWVAFETRNQLWLYDRDFTRPLERIDFGKRRWKRNQGIEAMAVAGAGILLFPEAGDSVVDFNGRRAVSRPLERSLGPIADVARLPGGGLVAVHRKVTPAGFSNAITLLEPVAGGGLRTARSFPLRGTRLDNVEAITAERLADGRTRLWLMTDDNYQRPLRTLLIALDIPKEIGG